MATKKATETTAAATKRLCRSESDRIIGGVCAGLAQYFDLDVSLVRLIFVIITLAGGAAVLVYLILWIILPTSSAPSGQPRDYIHANAQEIKATAKNFRAHFKNRDQLSQPSLAGLILLFIGLIFLLSNFGFLGFWNWHLFWPVILIAMGLAIIFKSS